MAWQGARALLALFVAMPACAAQAQAEETVLLQTLAGPKVALAGQSRENAIARLRQDELFMAAWEHRDERPGTISDRCDRSKHVDECCEGFDGPGKDCGVEAPEHLLVREWIPSGAAVMEFGARFGTTSCEIARKLGNSGQVVVVEPDQAVWKKLERNVKVHNCRAHILRGVLGNKPVQMTGSQYWARSVEVNDAHDKGVTPNYHFDEVEKALGLKIDTLLIDCEGCAQHMMDQIGPKIRSQINLIIVEADMGVRDVQHCDKDCMDYQAFFAFLEDSGFEMVDKLNDCDTARIGAPQGTWCGDQLEHLVFRRKQGQAKLVQRMRASVLEQLRQDELFMTTWPWPHGPRPTARTVSDHCDSSKHVEDCCKAFNVPGGQCAIDAPEHLLVRRWVPSGATVMEVGARFGTTSCEIARKLNNSGRVVSVEPDQAAWQVLEKNIKAHSCYAHVLQGVLGSRPVRMVRNGNATRSEEVSDADAGKARQTNQVAPQEALGPKIDEVVGIAPHFLFDEVEEALGLKIDTLLIGCVGCSRNVREQIGPKIRDQIDLVIAEVDAGVDGLAAYSADDRKLFALLEESGLEIVDRLNDCDAAQIGIPKGTLCRNSLWHFVFRRKRHQVPRRAAPKRAEQGLRPRP